MTHFSLISIYTFCHSHRMNLLITCRVFHNLQSWVSQLWFYSFERESQNFSFRPSLPYTETEFEVKPIFHYFVLWEFIINWLAWDQQCEQAHVGNHIYLYGDILLISIYNFCLSYLINLATGDQASASNLAGVTYIVFHNLQAFTARGRARVSGADSAELSNFGLNSIFVFKSWLSMYKLLI